MRELILRRPKRLEACAVTLHVELNGQKVGKLKNGGTLTLTMDDSRQTLRVHGGWMEGKSYQDQINLPKGNRGYCLQADFFSTRHSNNLPLLRPFAGTFTRDDPRLIAFMGATAAKLMLSDEIHTVMKDVPGARMRLVIAPDGWQLQLYANGAVHGIYRDHYAEDVGGIAGVLASAIERADLRTAEGRAHICSRILDDYLCALPDYVREGEDCVIYRK